MYKIRTPHKNKEGRIFSWLALLIGLALSLVIPIFPNFVKTVLRTDSNVSIFFSVMALMTLLGGLCSTIVFKKLQRTMVLKASFISLAVIYFMLIFVVRITELSVLTTIKCWFELFAVITLSLFVRDFSNSKNFGEEEGKYFKFQNIGYLIGPLLGGFLASQFGYEIVFILAAGTILGGFVYFYNHHVIKESMAIINMKKESTIKLIDNVKNYFSDPNRTKAYFISFSLTTWFMVKRLYLPLYIMASGYLSSVTGIVFSLGIIPFILLEEKVGKYADKKGIRLPISVGFFIIAGALLLTFISPFPILNFIIIILASIGAAFIEPVQEYFLLKNTPKEQEEDLFGIYSTSAITAAFFAPIIGALILAVLPFKFIFLVFAVLIGAVGFYFRSTLKDL
ncbi:MAG: MFS transporter [Candidatus Gracilibacteria bacterium]|jgi:DHA1 family multidrug resistance protein-like MFS transporter